MTPDVLRQLAVALTEHACGYDRGRSKTDPVYIEVSENEHGVPRARYSSCADLAFWLLERLGCREDFLNRASLGGWVPGVNVSRLAFCRYARKPDDDWAPQPGDIVMVWNGEHGNDAHVMVALELRDGKLRTGNYGVGGMSAAASPGARISAAPLTWHNGLWWYGAKRVQRAIDITTVPLTAEPNIDGAALAGELLDAAEFT